MMSCVVRTFVRVVRKLVYVMILATVCCMHTLGGMIGT